MGKLTVVGEHPDDQGDEEVTPVAKRPPAAAGVPAAWPAVPRLVSDISEELYAASWLVDVEHEVWQVLNSGRPWAALYPQQFAGELAALRAIAEETGFWVRWNPSGAPDVEPVPLAEWEPAHAAWLAREGKRCPRCGTAVFHLYEVHDTGTGTVERVCVDCIYDDPPQNPDEKAARIRAIAVDVAGRWVGEPVAPGESARTFEAEHGPLTEQDIHAARQHTATTDSSAGDPAGTVDWPAVWRDVAGRLAAHRAAGRAHVLTEDTVRLETVLALADHGVAAGRVGIEVLVPVLAGGKLDLVLDPPNGTVVELKYPRDSRTGISPDTMTFGELLRDFLRVAVVAAEDRWVVQVLGDRLARYLASACTRYGLRWAGAPGEVLELPASTLAALPATAVTAIGSAAVTGTVTATCMLAERVDSTLALYAYRVRGLPAGDGGEQPATAVEVAPPASPPPPTSALIPAGGTRAGARREILDAARAIVTRTGRNEFTMPDVIAEMRRCGTGYAEATIRTMISSHLCAEASGDGVAGYTDLSRAGRGLYRLTSWSPTSTAGRPPAPEEETT